MEALSASLRPQYILFGTYCCDATTIVFSSDGIQLTKIAPNCVDTKYKYHIMIPFVEIKELYYCNEPSVHTFLIKPTKESNVKIQDCMHLGKQSNNGFKFDIESKDFRQNYIITKTIDSLSPEFLENFKKWVKNKNPRTVCSEISKDKVKYLLECIQSLSPNVCYSEHPFEQKCDLNINKDMNELYELNNEVNEQLIVFLSNPIDVMFGTFRCDARELLFTLKYIKLIDINKNTAEVQHKYELIISFNEMKRLLYSSKESKTSLFIRITESLNQKIQDFLNVGNNSPNQMKFDVNSLDQRENLIIIVFNDIISETFVPYLTNISTIGGLKEISSESSKHMIEYTKTQNQLILSELKVKAMERDIIQLGNNCCYLKRKYEELKENDLFCAICLEKKNKILSNGRKMVTTDCGHIFCRECLDNALKVRKVCPTCIKHIKDNKFYCELYL